MMMTATLSQFLRRTAMQLSGLSLVALTVWPLATQAQEIEFMTPLNGWRNSAGEQAQATQTVNYPAVTVSTPQGQPLSAMIAGRIKQSDKTTRPNVATLVVNGIPLPQRIDGDGQFSRPYIFAPGSNSLEMRVDGSRRRIQFYDAYANKSRPRLRVVLAWDSDGTDLDLHVISPDGQHVWYGNRVVPNGGVLDVDVTTGYGPEIFSTANPLPGTYLVYVNYYGGDTGDTPITVAQLSVISEENTPDEKSQTVRIPMRRSGELMLVKTFTVR